jgi:predicted phage tail protein
MSVNLDVLDALFDIRGALTNLIVQVSPADDDEAAFLTQLVGLRDRLNGAINRLIALNVSEATADLEEALAKMRGAEQDMTAVSKDIAGVKNAITIAGQVLNIAAAIVGGVKVL